jgi:filamentous hemagglutinin family protein
MRRKEYPTNTVYRLLWRCISHTWIPVAEYVRRRGKAASGCTFTMLACVLSGAAWSTTGGEIASGVGAINQTGATTTITQNSQRMVINWQDFNIGAGQSVNFAQPNSAALALNRVLGAGATDISGKLSANGQVFILNPNGVVFGAGAQVNVGGLVATSLSLSDNDFNVGNYRFSKQGAAGSVINQGQLTAADGGYIALLAPEVRNEGTIYTRMGSVLLGAADQVTLSLNQHSLIGYTLDQGALSALVENRNLIQADGGKVYLTAKAANAFARAVVNNSGVIEAHTLNNQSGVIYLLADMQVGEVRHSGILDASAPEGGDGGFVETSAAQVRIADGARVKTSAPYGKTGRWLIDPSDFTIADSGGDISAATLASNLNDTDITLQTAASGSGNGDIFVNGDVLWNGAHKLSLYAYRNINVNARIANSQGGSLLLRADSTGSGSGTVNFGGSGRIDLSGGGRADLYYNPTDYSTPTDYASFIGSTPYTAWMLVNNVNDLQNINANLLGDYALGKDIDASATRSWNGGDGFDPIGTGDTSSWNPDYGNIPAKAFHGQFDGLGHTISDLYINRTSTWIAGLFSATQNATISNLNLANADIRGFGVVGGLVGFNDASRINNVSFSGNVFAGDLLAGGLVGLNINGQVANSRSQGTVTSAGWTGDTSDDYLSEGFANGAWSGTGGLVGSNYKSTISASYSTAAVSCGNDLCGGLVGTNELGTIRNSYSAGKLLAGLAVMGGLVGYNINHSTIENSYSTTDNFSSHNFIYNAFQKWGGLVGWSQDSTISNSYSSGSVPVDSTIVNIGGLIGKNDNTTVNNSFWNTDTSGQTRSAGGTGKTSIEMQQLSTFNAAGWDIDDAGGTGKIWRIYEGGTAPLLRNFLTTLTLDNAQTTTYDATTQSSAITLPAGADSSKLFGSLFNASLYGREVGTYSSAELTAYSKQQGYDIAYTRGNSPKLFLTINPAVSVPPLPSPPPGVTLPPGILPRLTPPTVPETRQAAASLNSVAAAVALLESMPPAAGVPATDCADDIDDEKSAAYTSEAISIIRCGIRLPGRKH